MRYSLGIIESLMGILGYFPFDQVSEAKKILSQQNIDDHFFEFWLARLKILKRLGIFDLRAARVPYSHIHAMPVTTYWDRKVSFRSDNSY